MLQLGEQVFHAGGSSDDLPEPGRKGVCVRTVVGDWGSIIYVVCLCVRVWGCSSGPVTVSDRGDRACLGLCPGPALRGGVEQ